MKYYFIAGEASGDLHASNLIRELVKVDQEAQIQGFGGELMKQAGMQLSKHYSEMAFMGIIPVLMNLKAIKKNFSTCEKDILDFQPDVLILVDYPGFNLRMAKFAKKHNISVFYYISPKIWAWKKGRIKKIRAFVDEMFTILPFETEFYKKLNFEVNYVGSPVLDSVIKRLKPADFEGFVYDNKLTDKSVIALLPGSRLQEIKSLLPRMLEAASSFSDYQMVVAAAPNIDQAVYNELLGSYKAALIFDQTYRLMQHADVAVLASGTVSLEAGVIKTPQIVCYRMAGGFLFFWIGKMVLKIDWVSLVNLILRRTAVRELLQHHCSARNIRKELDLILNNKHYREEIKESYEELHLQLGKPGASTRTAALMVEKLKS